MKRLFFTVACSLGLLLIILFGTNPNNLPSVMLIIPFVLLFALLMLVLSWYFRQANMPKQQSLRLSILAATLPCLLLVLQSVDQLTIRDVITIVCFFALASLYVVRASGAIRRQ